MIVVDNHAASKPPSTDSVDLAGREVVLRQADRALTAGLRAGLSGPDIERLTDWCAAERIRLRRARARIAVAAAIAMIDGDAT